MKADELFYDLDGTIDEDSYPLYPTDRVIIISYGDGGHFTRLEVTGATHSDENDGEFHIYAQRELK